MSATSLLGVRPRHLFIYLAAPLILATTAMLWPRAQFAWYECLSPPTQAGLEFDAPLMLIGGSGGPLVEPKVHAREWLSDGRLRIDVTVGANCGDICWTGSYSLADDRLTLLYRSHYRTFYACGENPVILRYEVSGLAHREYDVKVTDAATGEEYDTAR